MLKIIIVFLAIFSLALGQSANDTKRINPPECGERPYSEAKIVGGVQSKKGDWGWQVALYYRGTFFCGGSLINSQWVVTAAHCLDSKTKLLDIMVGIGFWNRRIAETWSLIKAISKIIKHESYNQKTIINDIALLKLSSPVTYNKNVVPVCIPNEDYNIQTDDVVYATGWGVLHPLFNIVPEYLMQVDMTVISEESCNFANRNMVNYTQQICAGIEGELKDTCKGDAGGPLVIQNATDQKWYLGGITSWGIGCTGAGVYTRTSAYTKWITDTLHTHSDYINYGSSKYNQTIFSTFLKLLISSLFVNILKY